MKILMNVLFLVVMGYIAHLITLINDPILLILSVVFYGLIFVCWIGLLKGADNPLRSADDTETLLND